MSNKIIWILLGMFLILLPTANATTFKLGFNGNEFSHNIENLSLNTSESTYGQTIDVSLTTKKNVETVSLTFLNGTNQKHISLSKTSAHQFSGKIKITSSFTKGNYKLNSIKLDHKNLVISDKKIKFTILDLPTPIIDQVTNQSTSINGSFLSNSHVEVYKDSTLINTVKTNENGEYNYVIKPFKEYTKLTIIGVSEGIKSKPTSIIVKDTIAPSISSVSAVTDQSQFVNGKSEPSASVKVYMNETLIGQSIVSSSGNFNVKIGKQKANSFIKVIVGDKSNNQSKPLTVRVSHYTPPVVQDTVKHNTSLSTGQLIMINTNTNKLTYYHNGKIIKSFNVATGKSSTPTPTGKFTIVNKIKNRPWYKGNIPGGDPRNPLGKRWMGLSVGAAYGIHGNSNESSIGSSVSSGCVRMHNSDIQWLFEQIKVGTTVIIAKSSNSNVAIAQSYGISIV
ncbi:L,D-transpeptidase family protein [Bacillus sp. AFS041924]|uniref:L,D-transpeptidase family protein n=1 Tax=Bacillus sp. AFS041924 TaxID=2033503 RepID=UPI00159B99C6|nr:L,D-transpeptidase family protein [Bacillus sp. AFS041924]